MKMYSKEGQCMVDVTKMEVVGDSIAMNCKLMGAYSMKVYLRPEEFREALKLVNWDLIKSVPEILITGTEGEETFRKIGKQIGEKAGDAPAILLGEEGVEKAKKALTALGADSVETLVNTLLMLAPVVFANKKK